MVLFGSRPQQPNASLSESYQTILRTKAQSHHAHFGGFGQEGQVFQIIVLNTPVTSPDEFL
jgi:hypothetical protein